MSKDKRSLAGALSQRQQLPPIQRGKGVQISVDESEQKSELATLQNSEVAKQQESEAAIEQKSKKASQQDSAPANLQISEIATPQVSNPTNKQSSEIAEEQISKVAVLLESGIADLQKSKEASQQDSEIAISPTSKEVDVKRINRGVTLPEDLFQEYKLGGVLLKVNMHRLMEEALTAYLPQLRARIEDRSKR